MAAGSPQGPRAVGSASAAESLNSGRGLWLWLLFPIGLLLSAVAAHWGIRHIEKQVLAAAPKILLDAGVDPSGLSFDTEYRNITVAGRLPDGVSVDEVRSILEQRRGAGGEDIRHAKVVAYEWVKPKTGTDHNEDNQNKNNPEKKNLAENNNKAKVVVANELRTDTGAPVESGVASDDPGHLAEADSKLGATTRDGAQAGTLPRVSILLEAGVLTLSGSDVSKAQIDRLLEAASISVGSSNVRQQWKATRLPGSLFEPENKSQDAADTNGQSIALVEPLAGLVATLGEHGSAASITLENEVISGSIEAHSERSAELLKASSGDGVVVTATVASEPTTATTANNENTSSIAAYPVQDDISKEHAMGTEANTSGNVLAENTIGDEAARQIGSDAVADAIGDSVADHTGNDAGVNAVTHIDADAAGVNNDTAVNADNNEVLRQEITALQLEIDALQKQIQENVFFVHDSSDITRQALPILNRVGDAIKRYRRPAVMISGHTDSLSSRNYNQRLSERRAAAVMHYLTANGIDAKRLRSEGFGEDRPVSSNKTLPGRRLNRRVEFTAREPFAGVE